MPTTNPQAHSDVCEYRNMQCRQCGQYVFFKSFSAHQGECPMRTTACQYCGREVPLVQMEVSVPCMYEGFVFHIPID